MALVLNSYSIAAFKEIRDPREIILMSYISLYLIAIIKLRDNVCKNLKF